MKILFIILFVFLLGCSSFEPIKIEGEPQVCNDMYTFMAYSLKLQGTFKKDTISSANVMTIVTLLYQRCEAARKEKCVCK